AAPTLCAVQAGQSGQPRPDWLSLTAAPVRMISAETTTPASAQRRTTAADGARSTPAQAGHRPGCSVPMLPAGRAGEGGGAGTPAWVRPGAGSRGAACYDR